MVQNDNQYLPGSRFRFDLIQDAPPSFIARGRHSLSPDDAALWWEIGLTFHDNIHSKSITILKIPVSLFKIPIDFPEDVIIYTFYQKNWHYTQNSNQTVRKLWLHV